MTDKLSLDDLPQPAEETTVHPDELHVDGDNPNEQSEEMFGLLCENLRQKGWLGNAIVADTDGCIADGEHRWRAAQEIGLTEVPVKFYDIAEDERRLWRQELNKISGEHDKKRDALEYDYLLSEGRQDDVADLTDAADEDLDELLEEIRNDTSQPPVYEYEPDHNVHFENCIEGMADRLEDDSVDLCVTSPPYAVNKEYEDDQSLSDFKDLITSCFEQVCRVVKPGGFIVINSADIVSGRTMHGADEIREIPVMHWYDDIMRSNGANLYTRVIWDKNNQPTAMHTIRSKTEHLTLRTVPEWEYLWVWKVSGSRDPPDDDPSARYSMAEWREMRRGIWSIDSVDANDDHPAKFPVQLPERVIKAYSFEGDTVLDPFMGSGTTAVAAIQNNRDYVGFELDEEDKYQPIIERRIGEAERATDAAVNQVESDD